MTITDWSRISELQAALRTLAAVDAWALARLRRLDAGEALTESDAQRVELLQYQHERVDRGSRYIGIDAPAAPIGALLEIEPDPDPAEDLRDRLKPATARKRTGRRVVA